MSATLAGGQSSLSLPVQARPRAIEYIFRLVAAGKVDIGKKISEEEVTVQIRQNFEAISRTPVREALAVMAAEGFVRQRAQVGCWILPVEPEEMREITSLRQGIEASLVERFAQTPPPSIWETFGRAHSAMYGDGDSLLAADGDFHIALAQASSAGVAAGTIRVWASKLRIFWVCQGRPTIDGPAVMDQHRELHDAIELRDPEAAVTAVEGHLSCLVDLIEARGAAAHAVPQPAQA